MADDRPAGDVVEELAALKKLVEDMRSTLMARTSRLPTGTFLATWLAVAPPDTLLLDGSTPLRSAYPVLWQYVQSNGLVVAGLFTVGNGTTTFGLPDYRGKVLRGKASGEAIGQVTGADSISLTTSQMPSHGHTSGGSGNHGHSFETDIDGSHGGHFPGSQVNVQSGGSFGVAPWNSSGTSGGSHTHTGGTTNVADHTHTINATGSGTAVDVRQAGAAVNWIVFV